jgi:DNA-binding SARP family transcriptional activator
MRRPTGRESDDVARAALEFRILGPLEAVLGGRPLAIGAGKQSALLALLLLSANRTVPVDAIVDGLWGEDVPESARKMVQMYVSRLRRELPDGILVTQPSGYRLVVDPAALDLTRAEGLLENGRAARAAKRHDEAASLLREALTLWRGSALAEFEEPFAATEAARIEEIRATTLAERIEVELEAGRHVEIVPELESVVAANPLRERLRSLLMLALYRCGRQADSLAVYREGRDALDELGIAPSAELRELEGRILRQDPTLAAPLRTRARGGSAGLTESEPASGGRELVGRDVELGRLARGLERAISGSRQLVFVTGEAGIGKTMLVETFLEQAQPEGGLRIARGQCIEHRGPGEPYLPLLEAFGRLCREPGGARVVALLAERAPTWAVQMPGLLSDVDLRRAREQSAGATRERMLRELVELLEDLAADDPLVLVLEDLHWSDPSTLDLLSAVAWRQDAARLLVVGTYRPAEAAAVSGLVDDQRLRGRAIEVALDVLARRDVADYVEARFPVNAFPVELAGMLHERTGGHPLFLHALLDAWVDDGAIHEPGGSWVLGSPVDELAAGVPATLGRLVGRQLDRLDGTELRLLETASVAGREFTSSHVAALSDLDEDTVETCLDVLVGRGGPIELRAVHEWPDGTVSSGYAFVHDLYQEVLYARIPPARRLRLHRQLGGWLEAAYTERPGEAASEIAAHFVRGRDAARAVPALWLAAKEALVRAGHAEAIEHLTAALAMLEALPVSRGRDEREVALRLELGNAIMEGRGYTAPEAKAAYTRARELCVSLGDTPLLVSVLNGLSTIAEVGGEYRAAAEIARESLRLAGGGPDHALADARASLGWPLFCVGEFAAVLETLEPVLDGPGGRGYRPGEEVHGQSFPEIEARAVSAWAHWMLGYADRADSMSQACVSVAEELGHAFSSVYAITCDAFLRQLRRERGEASERAATAARLAAELGLPLWEAWAAVVSGWAAAQKDDAVIAQMRAGLDTSAAIGSGWARTYLIALLAEAYSELGQLDAALETLEDAFAVAAAQDERFYEPELLRLQAELQLRLGREKAAEAGFAGALESARALEARLLELRAAVGLGRLRRDQGCLQEAAELVAGVYGWFTEGFGTLDLREARELLTELDAPVPVPGAPVQDTSPAR